MHEPTGRAERVFIGGPMDGEVLETRNCMFWEVHSESSSTTERYRLERLCGRDKFFSAWVHEGAGLDHALERLLDHYTNHGNLVPTGKTFRGQELFFRSTGNEEKDRRCIKAIEGLADRK